MQQRPCLNEHPLSPRTCPECFIFASHPVVVSNDKSESYRGPKFYSDGSPVVVRQIVVEADGIGDALLGLTAAEGLRRQGVYVVYVCRHEYQREFCRLFTGYDEITTIIRPEVPTFYPWTPQAEACYCLPRWEHYAGVCGTTAVLPELRELPAEAVTWSDRFRDVVALSPLSVQEQRCWPLEQWLELERLLIDRGERTAILAGKREVNQCAAFQGEKIIGQPAVRVATAILQAKVLIGNDSGMAHLAGMLRKDVVALCWNRAGENVYGLYPRAKWVQKAPEEIEAAEIADAALDTTIN